MGKIIQMGRKDFNDQPGYTVVDNDDKFIFKCMDFKLLEKSKGESPYEVVGTCRVNEDQLAVAVNKVASDVPSDKDTQQNYTLSLLIKDGALRLSVWLSDKITEVDEVYGEEPIAVINLGSVTQKEL